MNISHDHIYFGGATVKQLKKHMKEAIEGHIKNCKSLGIEPEKPYSGRITFRTTAKKHALFVEAAFQSGNRSLNEWMEKVLVHEAEKKLGGASF